MININSQRAKTNHQRKMFRMMLVLVNVQQREMQRVLNAQYLNAAHNIERGNRNLFWPIEQQNKRLEKLLLRHYKRIGRVFSKDALKSFNKVGLKNVSPEEIKEPLSDFWKIFNKWAAVNAADKVVKIQNTTRILIAQIITKGLADGLTNIEIAKLIRTTGLISNPKRALKIARTETHTGAVFAQDTLVNTETKRLGIKMQREWSTANDIRVRPAFGSKTKFNHRKADGQRRAQKKRFNVSGEHLMYPGDPSGSPGNIINCRCVLLYHTIKRKQFNRRAA
jgi:hypothetical protein